LTIDRPRGEPGRRRPGAISVPVLLLLPDRKKAVTGRRSKNRPARGSLELMKSLTPRIAARTLLLLGLAAALLLCPVAAAPAPAPAPPLPELNEKVVAFARTKVGARVGDGMCTSLAVAALKEAGAQFYPTHEPSGDLTWGQPIESFKDALPGDILQFRDAVLQGKKFVSRRHWVSWHQEYPRHTAIVARVSEGGKVVVVLHQNVSMQGKEGKDALNVQETTLPVDSLQKGGSIRIFRPIAAPGPRRRFHPDDNGSS
jgi:hypothetical protein